MALASSLSAGCDFDWNSYDPRLSSSATGDPTGTGAGGIGGGTSSGGTGSGAAAGTGGTGGTGETGGAATGGAGGTGGIGGTGGTGGGGTGGIAGPCGGTTLLRDEFDDGFTGVPWSWVSDPGVSVSEAAGEGVVSLPAGSGPLYGAFQTKRYYDLRKDLVSVMVTSVAAPATAGTFLIARRDADNYLELSHKNGGISCVKKVGGGFTVVATTAYDAAVHHYWRLRDDGNKTHCETPADGSVFLPFASTPTSTLFDLSSVRIDLGARLDAAAASPGEARFDDINGGGVSPGKWCPASTLTDEFDVGAGERSWLRSYNGGPGGCTVAKVAGELVFSAPATQTSYCAFVSSASHDMTESAVLVDVPVITDAGTATEIFLRLEVEGAGYLELTQTQGSINFRKNQGGIIDGLGAAVPYSAAAQWWRIAEKGGTVTFSYSADGASWTDGPSLPDPFAMTAVDILVGGGTYVASQVPVEGRFDHLNLAP